MRFQRLASAALAALALSTGWASAQQAAPGTTVTNTIDFSYSTGGTTISVTSAAAVSFKVDRKINLAVVGKDATAVVFAEQAADDPILTFEVSNLGNDTQGFDINVAATGSLGLTYDATGSGAEGTYWVTIGTTQVATSTEPVYDVTGVKNAADLAPSTGKFYVHVRANIAASATSGQTKLFEVTATALDKGATPITGTGTVTTEVRNAGKDGVDTVFADPGTNGFETARETLSVEAPELSASKTVRVISENLDGTFNCATGAAVTSPAQVAMIPGACVEYTISVTNAPTATLTARSLTITDPLPSDVTFKAFDKGDFMSVSRSGSTVTGNLDTLAPGATASFTIRATIGN